ncbi:MAG: AsmA family protein, partial [Candidatus Acidiferrales bacterium]
MSLTRKVLLAVAAVVVLAVAGVAVFVLTFDANRHRGLILAQLSRAVNRPVEAAELKLQLWPLRLRLAEVRVLEDPAFAGEEFMRARGVEFELELFSLLRGQPELLGLELDQPNIFLRQNPAGIWNAASVAPAGEAAEGTGAPAPAEPAVRNWGMREGTLVVERAGQPPLRLSGVEVSVSDFSTTRAFPFTLGVSFSPESRVSASGRIGPVNSSAPAQTPLEAELKLEKFRPAALGAFVTVPPALAALGALDGTASVKNEAGGSRLEAKLNL